MIKLQLLFPFFGNNKMADKAIRTALFSIFSNFFLALIKGVAGVFGNAYALIADAIESATDVVSSVLVLLGLLYAKRPADEDHPYGHGRIEPLITFMVVAFIITSALAIAYQSILNIRTPHHSPRPWTLIVLAVIIVWKEISFRYVNRKSEETHSTSLKADAWHHRSDAITSVIAFVGILIAVVLGPGYETADDWAALFASGFIMYNGFLIFRPALGEIMDEHQYDDLVDQIRQHAIEVQGVKNTEKCFVRKIGNAYHVDLHVEVDGGISVAKGHKIGHDVVDHLREVIPEINNVFVHIEPDVYGDVQE